jgi:hypothetical protein
MLEWRKMSVLKRVKRVGYGGFGLVALATTTLWLVLECQWIVAAWQSPEHGAVAMVLFVSIPLAMIFYIVGGTGAVALVAALKGKEPIC